MKCRTNTNTFFEKDLKSGEKRCIISRMLKIPQMLERKNQNVGMYA